MNLRTPARQSCQDCSSINGRSVRSFADLVKSCLEPVWSLATSGCGGPSRRRKRRKTLRALGADALRIGGLRGRRRPRACPTKKTLSSVAGGQGFADLSPCVSVFRSRTTHSLCATAAHDVKRVFARGALGIAGWRPGFARLTTMLSSFTLPSKKGRRPRANREVRPRAPPEGLPIRG